MPAQRATNALLELRNSAKNKPEYNIRMEHEMEGEVVSLVEMDPPAHLTPYEVQVWYDMTKRIPEGVVQHQDLESFTLYVQNWAAIQHESENKKGEVMNFTDKVFKMVVQHRQLSAMFGLSPADRSKVLLEKKKKEKRQKRHAG